MPTRSPDLALLEPLTPIDGLRPTLLADLVADLVADAEAAHVAYLTGRPRGPQTGLAAVDEALGGDMAPGVHVLQAAPGAAKTALALQMAATCGFPALYVSAEMQLLELLRRVTSRVTGTFLGKLKSGELPAAEVESGAPGGGTGPYAGASGCHDRTGLAGDPR